MPGMLQAVIHNWSILIVEAVRSGRVLDADLDAECWDRAVAIYFGRAAMLDEERRST